MTAASSSYQASDGAAYERFIGRWSRRVADRLAAEVAVPADGPLLDVGCGTGSVAASLLARHPGRRAVGVDVSEPYLAFARARPDCAGAEFRLGDALALDLPDASFAAAYALIALNFMSDPLRAAREMARAARSSRPPGTSAAASSTSASSGTPPPASTRPPPPPATASSPARSPGPTACPTSCAPPVSRASAATG